MTIESTNSPERPIQRQRARLQACQRRLLVRGHIIIIAAKIAPKARVHQAQPGTSIAIFASTKGRHRIATASAEAAPKRRSRIKALETCPTVAEGWIWRILTKRANSRPTV